MNAAIYLRLLEIRARRDRDLAVAANARLGVRLKRRPIGRLAARRVGLALIRLGSALAGPGAHPAARVQ